MGRVGHLDRSSSKLHWSGFLVLTFHALTITLFREVAFRYGGNVKSSGLNCQDIQGEMLSTCQ